MASDAITEALRGLMFAARTSRGVAGRDEALCAACDKAEAALAPSLSPQAEGGETQITDAMVDAASAAYVAFELDESRRAGESDDDMWRRWMRAILAAASRAGWQGDGK